MVDMQNVVKQEKSSQARTNNSNSNETTMTFCKHLSSIQLRSGMAWRPYHSSWDSSWVSMSHSGAATPGVYLFIFCFCFFFCFLRKGILVASLGLKCLVKPLGKWHDGFAILSIPQMKAGILAKTICKCTPFFSILCRVAEINPFKVK